MESDAFPGDDEPEPFAQLGGLALAVPSDEQPDEIDKALEEHLVVASESDPARDASDDSFHQRDAEAALKAAAELAQPAAEAAKAAAEEAMAEEDRRAEAEAPELVPSSSSDVNPPEHLPPPLEDMGDASKPLPPLPPLAPPSEPPRSLKPGQRVKLIGSGAEGVIEEFHEASEMFSVRLGAESVKVPSHEVVPLQVALPPLSVALPVQDDEPGVRSSLHSIGRNSELDTLQSLHIQPGSIFGRALLAYTTQVAKRPKRLLCFYSLAVLVPLVVGVIFRGFALETDFNAFIKADGAAMRDREAFQLAFTAKKDLNGRRLREEASRKLYQVDGDWVEEEVFEPHRRLEENLTSAEGRRLKTLFLRREYDLLYRAKSGNILDEKALQDIQSIEAGLRNLPGQRDMCENKITGANKRFLCDPGISIVATAFPTQVASSRGNIFLELVWNGLGRDLLPPKAITTYMKTSYERERQESRLSRRFFPETYSYPEIGTEVTDVPEAARSRFSFHLTLGQNGDPAAQVNANIQKVKAEWSELLTTELLPYFLEQKQRSNPQVELFWASTDIDGIEINSTLFNDLLMAIGSILFVILYLRIHTGSWIVSIASFLIIFISVPLAYIMTPAAKATIASFLSVFLITGIGCDVVFVFTDFWEQGHKLPLESRCMWMIVHAGESCLATSMTTALSFFANLASALQPLREFGMFMGLCVMCAFFLVLLMMPPLLVAMEKRKERIKARVVDISSGQGGALEDEKEVKKKDGLMQALLFTLMGGLASCPCIVLLTTVAFFFTAAIGVVVTARLSTGVPDIFPEWHNQVASKVVLELFSTEANLDSESPQSSLLCRSHTMNGTSTDGCSLHWCEAISTWTPTTTTTTTGSGRRVSCKRSPVLQDGDLQKQSVESNFAQICSEVLVFSRVALDTVATSDWTRTLTSALDSALGPTGYTPSSLGVSQLRPLVIENWETGEVEVSEFWSSTNLLAQGPFQQVQADANNSAPCEMHVLCFEENRYHCEVAAWTSMGSYSLSSRRLQSIVGTLVTQTVASAIDVSVLWGIRSARYTPLVGPPAEFWSFDPNFKPQNPWAQRAIRNMCTGIPEKLRVWRAKCWIHDFEAFLSNRNSRFPSRNFDEDIIDWYYANTVEAQAHLWFEDRKVIATKLQFFVNMNNLADASEGLAFMELWEEFVQAKNAEASITANAAWHTASIYVRAEAERAIIGSTIDTIIIATCSGWAGVFLFTFDVWLAVIVTAVVIVVITGLAFFISCIMAWSIGPIEVISLVVFVGYSVTYALHIAHNYNQMREDDQDLRAAEAKARQRQKERSKAKLAAKAARERARDPDFEELGVEDGIEPEISSPEEEELTFTPAQLRQARARVAVLHVGGATLSSALSTAGSSAFLLFCTLTIFVKLGAVVVAVTVLSILAAIVTLPAALILAGPAPDAWYKRKARELLQMLKGGGRRKEQDLPLLDEDTEDTGVKELS